MVYKPITPVVPYPFPWTSEAFFDAFPESRQGIGCEVIVPSLSDVPDPAMVLIVWPAWFLSPAIPLHGFFQNETVCEYLRNKTVVTVCGCRNMWVKAQEKLNEYLSACGANHRGTIILQDRHHNLVSVVTIIRWLIGGKQDGTRLFPDAGVSYKDIRNSSIFGYILVKEILTPERIQPELMKVEAIRYKPNIVFVEKVGHKIFGLWSKWILKRGGPGSERRKFRLILFKYYLFSVLFLVSPIGLLVFYLSYPLRIKGIRKEIQKRCYMK